MMVVLNVLLTAKHRRLMGMILVFHLNSDVSDVHVTQSVLNVAKHALASPYRQSAIHHHVTRQRVLTTGNTPHMQIVDIVYARYSADGSDDSLYVHISRRSFHEDNHRLSHKLPSAKRNENGNGNA